MKYVEAAGARVPALGLGTWQVEGDTCREMVESALELGYRHVDTAQVYENEDQVGRAIEASGVPREDLFLTSKLFLEDLTADRVPDAARASLDRLGTDHLDLLLIHWPNPQVPLKETLKAFGELVDRGAVRHVGVSNFPPRLAELAMADPDAPQVLCDQVEYHPYLDQSDVLATLAERGRMLTAYCPLARGRVAEDPVLTEIGERHGKSPAQVALRWLLQQDRVAAIPKAESRDHLEQNLDVFDFELADEEMERVFALARGLRLVDPDFAPRWS